MFHEKELCFSAQLNELLFCRIAFVHPDPLGHVQFPRVQDLTQFLCAVDEHGLHGAKLSDNALFLVSLQDRAHEFRVSERWAQPNTCSGAPIS